MISEQVKLGMLLGLFAILLILIVYTVYRVMRLRIAYLRRLENTYQDEEAFRNEALAEIVPFNANPTQMSEETAETSKQSAICESFDAEALWKKYRFSARRKEEEKKSGKTHNQNDHAVVTLSFYYQSYNRIFRVHVHSADIYKDTNTEDYGEMDTRVKLLLITALKRQIVFRTKIVKHSNNPAYDQTFMFPPLRLNKSLKGATLEVSFWSIDEFYQEDLIGVATLHLKDYDLKKRNTLEVVVSLEEEKKDPGFLFAAISYDRQDEKLTIILIKAFKLKCGRLKDDAVQNVLNPYAKVYLLCNGKKIKKQSTGIKWETPKPIFNELIEFIVPIAQLDATDVEILLMHRDKATDSKENIGRLLFGANSTGYCLEQWKMALEADGKAIAQWHKLQA